MPDMSWNKRIWLQRDWSDQGERWSESWGDAAIQWHCGILPRIRKFLPASSILEIAPGYGRWTQFLIPYAEDFFRGIDLADNCAAHCQSRFADSHQNIHFYSNDGISLKQVADVQYDFIFSYDSLVHASLDVLESYIPQILRQLLSKKGVAFIHHSNAKEALEVNTVTLSDQLHARDQNVSAKLVADVVKKNNGKMLLQETFPWGTSLNIDAFSIFSRWDSDWLPSSPLTIRNDDAITERIYSKKIFLPYSFRCIEGENLPDTKELMTQIVPSADQDKQSNQLPEDLLGPLAEYSEMSISENVFLYNLVKQAEPKKILEVGVAAGGSTLIFLEAIKEFDDLTLYSFDISDCYYKDISRKRLQGIRPTGFLVSELRPGLSRNLISLRHSGGLAACLDEIGSGIDFCLLDTSHSTPGELIDFLCLLPYLADGGTVVLHDINLQLFYPSFDKRSDHYEAIACRLLFNVVSATNKIVPNWTERPIVNIGAFEISDLTRNNIADIFNSLLMDWHYMPSPDFLRVTRQFLAKQYPKELLEIFDTAIRYNQELHAHREREKSKGTTQSTLGQKQAPAAMKKNEMAQPNEKPSVQYSISPLLNKWWIKLARIVAPKWTDAMLIAFSGAFDIHYYFTAYPELLKKKRNPIYGYVRKGAAEGRNPNSWFNTKDYLNKNPEAANSGVNPLVHYLYQASGSKPREGTDEKVKPAAPMEDMSASNRAETLADFVVQTFQKNAPESAKKIPAMLSLDDRAAYYYFASHLKFTGEIIDAGCFVGGTTRCLVEGIKHNPKYRQGMKIKVRVFDLFTVPGQIQLVSGQPDSYNAMVLREFYGQAIKPGTNSFRSFFDENMSDSQEILDVYEGDIIQAGYPLKRPIEFLGIDCCKNAPITDSVVRNFFPYLSLGSIVLHQDYLHEYEPFIHISMELLAEYFTPILEPKKPNSYAWECVKSITSQDVNRILGDVDRNGSSSQRPNWYFSNVERNAELIFKKQQTLLYDTNKAMLGYVRAMYYFSVGNVEKAQEITRLTEENYPEKVSSQRRRMKELFGIK